MTKSTVIKTWIAGLVAFAAGLLVAGISVFVMLTYGGHFTPAPYGANGYDFVPSLDGVFWATVGLIVVGGAVALVGGVIQLVAWVGALVNTNRLADKTWFAVLLFGGLLGVIFAPVGFAAMVAYVLAGPDGTAISPAAAASPVPSTTLAPNS
jgi:hypothetical protein